jgi:hypothetical protein
MNEKWFKDSHLCTICDALIEITRKDEFRNIWHCGMECNLLSVEDATILPTNERNEMETYGATVTPAVPNEYNSNLLVTYKKIAGTYAAPEAPEYITQKVVDLEWELDQGRRNSLAFMNLTHKIDDLKEHIEEWVNPNYNKQEVITELCEYFGINPTKTVTVTGTINFEVTIQVPFDEIDNFDALYKVGDELSLTSYANDVEVGDWTVDNVDVDWN